MDPYFLNKAFAKIKTSWFGEFPKLSYARGGEDLLLDDTFNQKSSGFYVDVGAYHPVKYSNTFKFYLKGWSGINVDPNKEIMDLFKSIRPRDINLNLAVGPEAGFIDYFMNPSDPSMNTVDPAFAKQAAAKYGITTNEVRQVPVDTLENIILESGCDVNAIDFLNVDVEGFDYEVLKSNNWEIIRPTIILVEINSRFKALEQTQICSFLAQQNYSMIAYTCLNAEVGNGFFMKNERLPG